MSSRPLSLVTLLLALNLFIAPAHAQSSTAFSVQAKLTGINATGTADLKFTAYSTDTGGTPGPSFTQPGVSINNGVFSTTVDFGPFEPSSYAFIEVAVSPPGAGTFTSVLPRLPITPAPWALTVGSLQFDPGTTTIDQQQTTRTTTAAVGANAFITQTFVAGLSGRLARVEVFAGATTGELLLEVLDGPTIVGYGVASLNNIVQSTNVSLLQVPILTAGNAYTLRLSNSRAPLSVATSGAVNAYGPGTFALNNVVMTGDMYFRTIMGNPRGLTTVNDRLGIGTETPATPLNVTGFSSTIKTHSGGLLMLGDAGSTHLVMDTANLQARAFKSSALPDPGTLRLNPLGGGVVVGNAFFGATPQARLTVSDGDTPATLAGGGALEVGSSFSGLVFDADLIQARNNSNDTAANLRLNPLGGNVGIGTGTSTLNNKLVIGGTAGTDGIEFPDATKQTTAYKPLRLTASTNFVSLPAGATSSVTYAVTGASVGDTVIINPRQGFLPPTMLLMNNARVSAAHTVAVTYINMGTTTLSNISFQVDITVLPK